MTRKVCMADVEIAARTVYGEARGEDGEGMYAVAKVLVNRWRTFKGQFKRDNTLATACLRHMQFSAWNNGDPNLRELITVGAHDRHFREALVVVLQAIDSPIDPTKGALWYHTKRSRPRWSRGKKPCAVIGNHKFYNDID